MLWRVIMKNCVITGGNSGIGFQAAVQIAAKGYGVTIICRNESSAQNACAKIASAAGNRNIDYLIADLSEMNAVRKAAAKYLDAHSTLDVLINNAADFDLSVKTPVMTSDGMEKQFATNVAAPFLLSHLLFDALDKAGNGRIINVSSKGLCVYPFIKLDFQNLNGEQHYNPANTYYQNKLALMMHSLYLADIQQQVQVQAIRVTNVKIDMSRYRQIHPILKQMYQFKARFSISPQEMAKVYTALATTDTYNGFLYDEKCQEVRANKYAYDKQAQKRLYELLYEKTGLSDISGVYKLFRN